MTAAKKTPALREAEIVRLDDARDDAPLTSLCDLTLEEIAKQADAEQRKAMRSMERGALHAFRCGQLLLEARERIKKEGGSFTAWLEANCSVSRSHAYRYIAIVEASTKEEAVGVSRVRQGAPELTGVTQRKLLESIGKPVEQAEKKKAAAEERRAAAAPIRGEGAAPGAPKPEEFEPEPDERLNGFEKAVDLVRRATALLKTERFVNAPAMFARARDEEVEQLQERAGHLATLGQDLRESLGGSKKRRA